MSESMRMIVERVLRDADDDAGQTIRRWRIELEGHHITLRRSEDDIGLLIRAEDVELLVSDLSRLAVHAA